MNEPEIVFDCLNCDTEFAIRLAAIEISDRDITCPICGWNRFMATTTGFGDQQ